MTGLRLWGSGTQGPGTKVNTMSANDRDVEHMHVLIQLVF